MYSVRNCMCISYKQSPIIVMNSNNQSSRGGHFSYSFVTPRTFQPNHLSNESSPLNPSRNYVESHYTQMQIKESMNIIVFEKSAG